jgi:Flp pilus assembly protein TadG
VVARIDFLMQMKKRGQRMESERNRRGAVAVEFALVLPLLMMLVFGIIDFGRAYYTLNQVISSVREGARYAAVLEDPMAQQADIRKVVTDFTVPMGGKRITSGQVEIALDQVTGRVTVRVRNYPFELITPLAKTFGAGELLITREATFRWERAP